MDRASPIDLCSHRRSGTHYLASTLLINFLFPPGVAVAVRVPAGRVFRRGRAVYRPGEVAPIPWGGIWRSHYPYAARARDPARTLYVARDPVETLMSCWRLSDPTMISQADAFVGPRSVEHWLRHVVGFIDAGIEVVWYDDLAGPGHDAVLARIEARFGLHRRQEAFRRQDRRVGWYPYPEPQQPQEPPPRLLNAVFSMIPREHGGHVLRRREW